MTFGPLIHGLKRFLIQIRIRGDIRLQKSLTCNVILLPWGRQDHLRLFCCYTIALLFVTKAETLVLRPRAMQRKGIVSQKFYILVLFLQYIFERLEVSTPLLFYPFFKISSFLYKIFECTKFSGEILLSHNTVNEMCYVVGFVNSIVTYHYKKPPLNIL
jgi:hypothetical protein